MMKKLKKNRLFTSNRNIPRSAWSDGKPKEEEKVADRKEEGKETKKPPTKKEETKKEDDKGKEDKAKEDKAKEDKERINKVEMEKIEKEKLQKMEDMKKKKRAENRPVLMIHKHHPIKSWNLTLLTSFNLPEGGYAKSMCLNYEQDLLVIGTKQGFIHMYNIKTQDYIDTLKFHKSTLKCLAYLNDKVSVISGDNDGRLIRWNLNDRNYIELITNSKEAITSIINNARGEKIYVSCGNDILVYDIFAIENTFDYKIPMNDYIQCMVYLSEEKLLAVGLRSGEVKIVNTEKKRLFIPLQIIQER